MAEAVQVLATALPGARFLPALRRGNVHGALDMGLAPGLLPGRVALEAGRQWFTRAWGSGARHRGRAGTPQAGILRRRRPGTSRPRSRCRGPRPGRAGGRPADRLPRPPAGRAGPGRRRVRGGGGLLARAGHRTRRRGAAGRRGPRAPGHHHQHRGADQPAGPEAGAARPGLARLDDRRRAGRAPGRRPRPRLGRRRLGRDRAAGPGLPGHHPGACSTPRVRPTAWWPRWLPSPVSLGRRRAAAARPHRLSRGGVGRAAGGAAPGRPGRVAHRRTGRGRRRAGHATGRAGDEPRSAGPAHRRWSAFPSAFDVPHVGPGRPLLAAPGGRPRPLRPRVGGGRGPRPGRAGGLRAAAGQPPRPRRPGGGPGRLGQAAQRLGLAGGDGACPTRPCPAGWWPPTSTCRSTSRRPVADLIDSGRLAGGRVRMETP